MLMGSDDPTTRDARQVAFRILPTGSYGPDGDCGDVVVLRMGLAWLVRAFVRWPGGGGLLPAEGGQRVLPKTNSHVRPITAGRTP